MDDLWQKIQDQQAALAKLQRKHETVKGDLRKTAEQRDAAEARLSREPALVEALRQARADIVHVNRQGFDSHRGQAALEAITRIDVVLYDWEQE